MADFATVSTAAMTIIHSVLFLVFVVWPVFIIYFLIKRFHLLDEAKFLEKYESIILGQKTEHPSTYLYNAFFCIRRFALVMCYVTLAESDKRFMVPVLMLIQSIYLVYVVMS